MVLDIDLFRVAKPSGNPDIVRKSQKDRFADVTLVDTVINLDEEWVKERFHLDTWNRMRNVCNKAIGEKKKKKESDGTNTTVPNDLVEKLDKLTIEDLKSLQISQILTARATIEENITKSKERVEQVENDRNSKLALIGNLLHESVPISDNEDNNRVERTFGDIKSRKKYSHVDLVVMIDGFDGERGTAVAGGRGYFLKGALVFLEQACIQLALRILLKKDFTPLYTPFFMRKDAMQEVAQLSQFDDELYKVR
uniref:Serine-tRNA synthetase type1 N-terminal domain-containing protein n=3 Tax=Panagrolaimus TaxID=55784 RepID=A0A914XX11_9BILA